mgnify:CR=1 FL=1
MEGLYRIYNDNMACASFIINISKALEVEIFNSVRKSPWFSLMALKTLGNFYNVEKVINGKTFPPIIDNDKLYEEYVIFKRQSTTKWLGRDFLHAWSIINYSEVWREKLPKLLKLSFNVLLLQLVREALVL